MAAVGVGLRTYLEELGADGIPEVESDGEEEVVEPNAAPGEEKLANLVHQCDTCKITWNCKNGGHEGECAAKCLYLWESDTKELTFRPTTESSGWLYYCEAKCMPCSHTCENCKFKFVCEMKDGQCDCEQAIISLAAPRADGITCKLVYYCCAYCYDEELGDSEEEEDEVVESSE
jgi:hypothetical protein